MKSQASQREHRRIRRFFYRAILLLGIANGLGALLNGISYLEAPAETLPVVFFKYCAYFANLMFPALLAAGLACLIFALARARFIAGAAAVVFFSLLQFFVFADVRVYQHLRFHINGMVLEAMMTPGYWDSVHFTSTDTLLAALGGGLTIGAQVLALLIINRSLRRGGLARRLTRPRWTALWITAILVTLVGEKIAYGISDFYAYIPITRYRKVYPLYQPLTFKRNWARLSGETPAADGVRVSLAGSSLDYPHPGYLHHPLSPRLNVLVILVESLRFDMFGERETPQLWRFSRDAVRFNRHYSGGNTSRFGGFSLIYGLYASYWHPILAERKGPVMLTHLAENGYEIKGYSSTSLEYPEFRKTIFTDFPDGVEDRMPAEAKEASVRDRILVDRFRAWLKKRSRTQPFFCFAFLDSPHSPYSFFPQDAVFEPYWDEVNYIKSELRPHREKIFNRYRNAVHGADRYAGEMLQALIEEGLLDKTIVVVTGDHGEEFWEKGFFGHNSAYTDYQTRVPLILRIPGKPGGEIDWETNHGDVPVTILNLLGNQNPPELFTTGRDLFAPQRAPYMVLAGWSDCCLFTPGHKLRFALEAYSAFREGALDRQDNPAEDSPRLDEEKNLYLVPALEGMGRFLK